MLMVLLLLLQEDPVAVLDKSAWFATLLPLSQQQVSLATHASQLAKLSWQSPVVRGWEELWHSIVQAEMQECVPVLLLPILLPHLVQTLGLFVPYPVLLLVICSIQISTWCEFLEVLAELGCTRLGQTLHIPVMPLLVALESLHPWPKNSSSSSSSPTSLCVCLCVCVCMFVSALSSSVFKNFYHRFFLLSSKSLMDQQRQSMLIIILNRASSSSSSSFLSNSSMQE